MPEPKDLHQDSTLSNISVKYVNEELIWESVMPVAKVNKRSDKFYVYDKAEGFRVPDDALGPISLPNEVKWATGDDDYSVKDHGLADYVSKAEEENADAPLQPRIDTTENLTEQLDLAQEKRVAGIVFAAGTYPVGNKVQLSGNDQWSGSTDDPIGVVLAAIEACFKRANTLVFGVDVWKVFRSLPEIIDAVYQGSPGGVVTASAVAKLFEVEKVLIGRARETTSKKGQTATYGRLWGKHCAALYVQPSPGIKKISFGYTFAEMLRKVFTAFDIKRGTKGATYVKVACNSDEKVIAADCGYLIQDAVA